MHLHNYKTVELYAQSDGGAFAQVTVKHINAIIIWYHMHDVEMLGVAFSRVNCDIYEMIIETLMCDVMLFMMMFMMLL